MSTVGELRIQIAPGNDHALDVLTEIENTLTTWARHIAETRGVPLP